MSVAVVMRNFTIPMMILVLGNCLNNAVLGVNPISVNFLMALNSKTVGN